MAPHSSALAWKIPWTEEPGRLQSMGSLRVGHDSVTSLSLFTFMRWRRKWHPTPVFLPGESQGWQSLVGCRLWGRTESDMTGDLAAAAAAAEVILNSTKPHWALVFIFETLWLDISGKQTCFIWELSNRALYHCMKLSTPNRTSVSKPLTVWVNTRPPDLPPEKSVCRSRSNS